MTTIYLIDDPLRCPARYLREALIRSGFTPAPTVRPVPRRPHSPLPKQADVRVEQVLPLNASVVTPGVALTLVGHDVAWGFQVVPPAEADPETAWRVMLDVEAQRPWDPEGPSGLRSELEAWAHDAGLTLNAYEDESSRDEGVLWSMSWWSGSFPSADGVALAYARLRREEPDAFHIPAT